LYLGGGHGGYGLSYGSRPPDIITDVRISAGGLSGGGVSPGDINGDGYGDLLKYLPYGSYALYLGGSTISGLIAKLYVSNYFQRYIDFAGRVGDVNGDGIDDICVGENGSSNHNDGPSGDIYIYKGTRTPVSVREESDIESKLAEFDVKISPNPTSGPMTIQYSLPDTGTLSFEIFDILGQKIHSYLSEKEKGTQTEKINLQTFAGTSGIYIIHFIFETGEKTLTKSVKVQLIK
jgi:hypothetical protein